MTDGTTKYYTTNSLNQLLSTDEDHPFTYDDNVNLTSTNSSGFPFSLLKTAKLLRTVLKMQNETSHFMHEMPLVRLEMPYIRHEKSFSGIK